MLAVIGSHDDVLGVHVVRRRHPDDFDVRVFAECLHAVVGAALVAGLERVASGFTDVGGSEDVDLGHALGGLQNHAAADSEPSHAQLEGLDRGFLGGGLLLFEPGHGAPPSTKQFWRTTGCL